jgi:hypothetical protein
MKVIALKSNPKVLVQKGGSEVQEVCNRRLSHSG